MRFYFHPEAEEELDKAVAYYEECHPGLGLEFAKEVYTAIARIMIYPQACTPMTKRTRRSLINRFPFGLIYRMESDTLQIIAVANLHRRPGYWKKRTR